MRMNRPFRGIFGILPTPFDDDLTVHYDDLRRIVRFCIAAGASGIVTPAVASEFHLLSREERLEVVKVTASEARGRIPMLVGVTDTDPRASVVYARHAEDCGADGILAAPPYPMRLTDEEIFDYYVMLAGCTPLPIMVQNFHLPPLGCMLSPEFLVRLVKQIPNVRYIKEETQFASQMMSKTILQIKDAKANGQDQFGGIMGGKSTRFIIDEYLRGACGNMPACHIIDAQMLVWSALEQGQISCAQQIHTNLLPLIQYDDLYPMAAYKEVLKARGIISCAATRNHAFCKLDVQNQGEFQRALDLAQPYLMQGDFF